MTVYRIPPEPAEWPVWTRDKQGKPVAWVRTGADGTCDRWVQRDVTRGGLCTWLELLQHGPVFTTHPTVADWPTPWSYDPSAGVIRDAAGAELLGCSFPEVDLACFVTRVVNEWADSR